MKDTNIQWHSGFVGAINLEFKKNYDDLLFEKEHHLNTRPLEIDLLWSEMQRHMDCFIILRNMIIWYQVFTVGYIILKEKYYF